MGSWTVVGLWQEGRAVALACDVLRGFGADVLPPPGADPAAAASDLLPPATPQADDPALPALLRRADAVLYDAAWAPVVRASAPAGRVRCEVVPWAGPWPFADASGLDLVVQAAGGIAATNGYEHDPPLRAGVPLADVGTALAAAAAVSAALLAREDGGADDELRVVGEHVMASYLATLLPRHFADGSEPARLGNRHAMTAPWNTYPTRDGWLVISTMGDALWGRLGTLMGRPELLGDPRFATAQDRVDNVDALDAEIATWTADLPTDEAVRLLREAQVPASPIPTAAEAMADPDVRRRSFPDARRGPVLRHATPAPGTAPPRRWRGGDGSAPLAGLRVLELGVFTAGPVAAKILGHLGADVLKVEPPGGENCRKLAQPIGGTSYLYHLNNTDKRACVLDLTAPEDHERLLELAAGADVYITNMALPTLEKLRVTPADLVAVNPGLVACAITGFGLDGPRARERAFDTVVQAAAGVMALTGRADGPPLKTAVSMADLLAGWTAVVAVLTALADGPRGCVLDVALRDAAVWSVHTALADWRAAGHPDAHAHRSGNDHPLMAPHGCYPARDGYVALAVRDDDDWRRLVSLLPSSPVPAAAGIARRRQAADAIGSAITGWTTQRDAEEAAAALAAAGLPAAPVRSLSAVTSSARASGLMTERDLPGGERLQLLRVPLQAGRGGDRVPATAPALGSSEPRWLATEARRAG